MRIFKTVLVASLISLPMVAAHAADAGMDVPSDVATTSGFYLRGDVGASFLNYSGFSNDTSWVAGGGFGYQFNDNFRADMTVDWSGKYAVAPGADMRTTAVLGNVYFDWKNDSMFTPYVGAGLGYGWAQGANYTDGKGIAAGLAAGVSVDMTSNLSADIGYRFRDIMLSGTDPQEHQVTAGLRFKF
jgi:opacity protein-like surface antigen